jgi:hypothetical protein
MPCPYIYFSQRPQRLSLKVVADPSCGGLWRIGGEPSENLRKRRKLLDI